jgi:hypothetical protein
MTMCIRLGGINDLSPSLRLGDEGIDSILLTLQGLRDRVLSVFTCLRPSYTISQTCLPCHQPAVPSRTQ